MTKKQRGEIAIAVGNRDHFFDTEGKPWNPVTRSNYLFLQIGQDYYRVVRKSKFPGKIIVIRVEETP